ncbi:MAG: hypothetical protein Q4F60_01540 [Candidatus Saccharibacteria bacterium]|nr:hypothetical protein [Candidatus Saccharibacteria bacterium]
MSEELKVRQVVCDENPMLATMYMGEVSYAEVLEAAFKRVELTWRMKEKENERNERIWADFRKTRDKVRREVVRLRQRIAALDRGGGRQNILRHAYLYRIDDSTDAEDELEIEDLARQIKSLEMAVKQKLIKAEKTERYEWRRKFLDALNDYKEIISQYCKERIRKYDLDFSPGDPVTFRWKWDLGAIAVYYGGNNDQGGHGHAEFSMDGLRFVYLRPAFWGHDDWLIRKSRFRNMKLIEEEWPEKHKEASNETQEQQTSKVRKQRTRVIEEKRKRKRGRNMGRRRRRTITKN